MSKNAVVFILLSLAITLSSPAFCQKKRAKELFDEGVSALEKRNFKKALDTFEEAYEISPHWAVLAHIGTCHANLNQPIKAIEALNQYLEDGGNNIPEDEIATAKEIIKNQRKKVGVLILSVKDEGVEALVDGESIGNSPFKEKLLLPGTHEVAVVFAENDIVRRNFEISAGQEYLLRIEQEQHLSTAPPPPPTLTQPEPTPSPEEEEKETPLPTFSAPPMQEEMGKSNLTPFYIALGFTVASAAVAGVGWGFYTHYKLSESNYADYLATIKSVDSRFEDYTWEDTCQTIKQTEKTAVHYCNTELTRRDFADSADTWFIVGIAGSGSLLVSGTLTIVFYTLRYRLGRNKERSPMAVNVFPHISSESSGLHLSVNF